MALPAGKSHGTTYMRSALRIALYGVCEHKQNFG